MQTRIPTEPQKPLPRSNRNAIKLQQIIVTRNINTPSKINIVPGETNKHITNFRAEKGRLSGNICFPQKTCSQNFLAYNYSIFQTVEAALWKIADNIAVDGSALSVLFPVRGATPNQFRD